MIGAVWFVLSVAAVVVAIALGLVIEWWFARAPRDLAAVRRGDPLPRAIALRHVPRTVTIEVR